MHYLASDHWKGFCTNWVTFDEVFHDKLPKLGPK